MKKKLIIFLVIILSLVGLIKINNCIFWPFTRIFFSINSENVSITKWGNKNVKSWGWVFFRKDLLTSEIVWYFPPKWKTTFFQYDEELQKEKDLIDFEIIYLNGTTEEIQLTIDSVDKYMVKNKGVLFYIPANILCDTPLVFTGFHRYIKIRTYSE